jgi:hypothetical protein
MYYHFSDDTQPFGHLYRQSRLETAKDTASNTISSLLEALTDGTPYYDRGHVSSAL